MENSEEHESRYYIKYSDDSLRCIICPRMCVIKPGQRGFCNTKVNKDNRLINLTYGKLSALAIDPIEKKPLFHFHPGSLSLSISSIGCSFTCPWCQNWHLSQSKPEELRTKHMSPREIVAAAKRQECTSISYTYNEPLINLDYVEDCSRLARMKGIKNVLVTNGYVSKQALNSIIDVIDAANVDWKSFSEPFYRKYCSADLKSVLDATEEMKKKGVHVEVTFLIIPEVHDAENETREMAKYLVETLGPDTPLHLSRFFPNYKFTHLPPTPVETLVKARDIARKMGVKYVYVGNLPGEGYEDTLCPRCSKPVVRRIGFDVVDWHLDEDNCCNYCGEPIPITGKREKHENVSWF
ncbi:MAG: AmmeMemoRadiSam system radical SAM enzyme [Candidatus Bathyarchaeia archaeon]